MIAKTPATTASPTATEKPRLSAQWLLYRRRYIIGYALFAAVLLFFVLFNFYNLPAGLSQSEIDSVTASAELSLNSLGQGTVNVLDLPYHLLQKASLTLFGANVLAIRLPSVILAIMAGVLLERLLQRLFRKNIAVISAVISVSTIMFLTIARTGAPVIMMIFLTLAILYLATRVLRGDKGLPIWAGLLCASAALVVYSPLAFIFILLALGVILHPKGRARFKAMPKSSLIIVATVILLLLAPLIIALILDFSGTAAGLLAFGSWHNLTENLSQLAAFGLGLGASETTSIYALPMINLVTLAVVILGLVRCCRDIFAARSYLLLGWIVALIPILLFNADAIHLLFVPFALLTAVGVCELVGMWNRLFPFNPYARVVGLVPVCILMLGVIYTTNNRYLLANNYEPNVVRAFDQAPVSLMAEIDNYPDATLLVGENEERFYKALKKDFTVTTEVPETASQLIVTPAAYQKNIEKLTKLSVVKITTSQLRENSVLIRVYEKK